MLVCASGRSAKGQKHVLSRECHGSVGAFEVGTLKRHVYWSSDGSSAPASAISCSATFASTTLSLSHLCAPSWRPGGKLPIAPTNKFFNSSSKQVLQLFIQLRPPYFETPTWIRNVPFDLGGAVTKRGQFFPQLRLVHVSARVIAHDGGVVLWYDFTNVRFPHHLITKQKAGKISAQRDDLT